MTYVFVKRTWHVFKRGDKIEDVPNPVWISEGRVKPVGEEKKIIEEPIEVKEEPTIVEDLPEEIKDRIEDFKNDLEDDGKRNYSNRKPKKAKKN